MNNPTMLYKCPGPHPIHGGNFDYTVVDEADVEAALAKGWHLTTPDAQAAHDAESGPADDAPPTRAELLAKAVELGLQHKHNISNVALAELVADALKPKD